ncbi:MAG: DUF6036 family nucleotidyltransferase [Candidatus Omnitrophota bacterium]
MEYRLNKQNLFDTLSVWNGFLKRKVTMIACGGTALTLLDIKPSTKDVDLLIPREEEYAYLVKVIEQLGYRAASGSGWARDDGFIFDLFRGKSVHTTELLDSPLIDRNHIPIKQYSSIYLGVLNYYDIFISKLFRSASVDIEDCLLLLKNKKREIDIKKLIARFEETASYNVSEDTLIKNLEHFIKLIKKKGHTW